MLNDKDSREVKLNLISKFSIFTYTQDNYSKIMLNSL